MVHLTLLLNCVKFITVTFLVTKLPYLASRIAFDLPRKIGKRKAKVDRRRPCSQGNIVVAKELFFFLYLETCYGMKRAWLSVASGSPDLVVRFAFENPVTNH